MLSSDIVYFNPLLQPKVINCTVNFAACVTSRDTSVIIRIINTPFLKQREYDRFSPFSWKNSFLKQSINKFYEKVSYMSSRVFQNFSYYSVWPSFFFILQLSKCKYDFFLGNQTTEKTYLSTYLCIYVSMYVSIYHLYGQYTRVCGCLCVCVCVCVCVCACA